MEKSYGSNLKMTLNWSVVNRAMDILSPIDFKTNKFLLQFCKWLEDAVNAGLPEPRNCALSTADKNGKPYISDLFFFLLQRSSALFL